MAESPALRGRILVADDDGPLGRLFKAVLAGGGHEVEVVTDGETARQRITNGRFDLVLVDLTMAPVGGLELLEHSKTASPGTTVVMITGNATAESAVEALKRGAHDYLIKPVQNEQLLCVVRRVLEMKRLGEERRRAGEALKAEKQRNATLIQDIKARYALSSLSGSSGRMNEVRSMVEEVIRTDSTVLILGESGTGKSLLARTIHFNSHRAEHPFIETNCAIYSEGLLMSELFGHESGAFTGAVRQKKGRFELAEGGTVFLDEIGDIPGATQIALLRFLQERRFERVGGEETIESDVRVITATNRDLGERMKSGAFRQDLFYRLNVIPITLPPLRERQEDIAVLASHILADCAIRLRREVKGFTTDAMDALLRYSWPGNIREMENAIERSVLLTHDELVTSRHLPQTEAGSGPAAIGREGTGSALGSSLMENEKNHIVHVLEQCRWNKKKAAVMLGINRSSLYSKLKRFGLMEAEAPVRSETGGVGVSR
ncbi:MAG TPA: sigma-54 dependent transcriptional regulator [Candidatus Polarisedimenticolia bacterium]|jgi:DNA-binding NtrC family response regulator